MFSKKMIVLYSFLFLSSCSSSNRDEMYVSNVEIFGYVVPKDSIPSSKDYLVDYVEKKHEDSWGNVITTTSIINIFIANLTAEVPDSFLVHINFSSYNNEILLPADTFPNGMPLMMYRKGGSGTFANYHVNGLDTLGQYIIFTEGYPEYADPSYRGYTIIPMGENYWGIDVSIKFPFDIRSPDFPFENYN